LPAAGWAAAPGGAGGIELSHPAGPTQRVEQVSGLLCVELLPQGIAPHIFERHLGLAPRPYPAQHPLSVNVPFGEADLPQGCPRVGPEVFPNEPNSGDHVLGINARRRRSPRAAHGPVEQAQGPGKTQHMRWSLGEPLPIPALDGLFLEVRKLPKLLELPQRTL